MTKFFNDSLVEMSRFEWIKKMLDKHSNLVCYDIGSGSYKISDFCETSNLQYYSFDINPKDTSTLQWDIEEESMYNIPKADLVIMLELIEHLQNPWICLKNINRVSKINSTLYITTPNPHWSKSRMYYLLTGNIFCFTKNDLIYNNHVFTLWHHVMVKLLLDNGYEVLKIHSLDGTTKLFDKPIRLNYIIVFWTRLLQKIIEYFDPKSVGMAYCVVAKKINNV